jgi:hypothetical protein
MCLLMHTRPTLRVADEVMCGIIAGPGGLEELAGLYRIPSGCIVYDVVIPREVYYS